MPGSPRFLSYFSDRRLINDVCAPKCLEHKTFRKWRELRKNKGWVRRGAPGLHALFGGIRLLSAYKFPECNTSKEAPSGRSGGGLVVPWTCPGGIEPLERAIFDHRSLCNSGSASSASEPGSGKVGKWGRPEIDRTASPLHPRWETVLHTGARQSPRARNEPRFRAALGASQRSRRPYTHNRARQRPDWPEPGNAPATMCSNTRALPGARARSCSPDSAVLGPVGLKRLVRPGGSSARRVPRLPAPQSTACMDRAACRTITPRPAVPGLQTARSVWSAAGITVDLQRRGMSK